MEEKYASLLSMFRSLESSKEESEKRVESLERQLHGALEDYERDLEQSRQDISFLAKKNQALKLQLRAYQESRLEEHLSHKEQEIQSLMAENSKLLSIRNTDKDTINSLINENSCLKEELNESYAQLDNTKRYLHVIEQAKQNTVHELSQIRKEKLKAVEIAKRKQQESSKIAKSMDEKEKFAMIHQREYRAVLKKYTEVQKKHAKLSEDYEKLQEELNSKNRRLDSVRNCKMKLDAKNCRDREDKDALVRKINELEEENKNKHDKIAFENCNLLQKNQMLEKLVQQFKIELNELTKENMKLKNETCSKTPSDLNLSPLRLDPSKIYSEEVLNELPTSLVIAADEI